MKRSQVIIQLANIASKGKYEVSPEGAAVMNTVFQNAAAVINELEAEEAAAEAAAEYASKENDVE